MSIGAIPRTWDARCDFGTLSEAAEILDSPKRLAAALSAGKKKAAETSKAIDAITGLRRSNK